MSIEVPSPWPVEINLSVPVLRHIAQTLTTCPWTLSASQETELYNFRNLLLNLIERSIEPESKPENFDLIGG